jgi:threonine/homoserine/homoserine lactone efflux protein
MTFLEAAAFQWLNPKAWLMAITAVSTFAAAETMVRDLAIMMVIFILINPAGTVPWVMGGMAIRRIAADQRMLARINLGLALALVVSLWPLLRDIAHRFVSGGGS